LNSQRAHAGRTGKFWAKLTPNQPDNYLKEITDDGKILFLTLEKRIGSLNIEIAKRSGEGVENVVVYSWTDFLTAVETQNNKDHNHHLASDLLQIHELCQKMDVEGMPPLSASDLDPMNGRVASKLSDVIDECNTLLREWEHSDFQGLNTVSKKYGHGFYFRGCTCECFLENDSRKWFVGDNHTPIWLRVIGSEQMGTEKRKHHLNEYDALNAFDTEYGMMLHEGMDKRQAAFHIVDEVKDVLSYLQSKIEDG